MKKKRSRSRALWLIVLAASIAVALILFPSRGKRAHAAPAAAGSAGPAEAAPTLAKKAKKGATPGAAELDSGVESAHASADGGSPEAANQPPPPGEAAADKGGDTPSLPIANGLPVRVAVAVFFVELGSFDDTKGEYEATTDLRLRWMDSRVAFPANEAYRGFREWLGKAAEDEVAKIWSPTIDVTNRIETGSYVGHRLRIYPSGLVELMTRTTGKYKTTVRPESFPFDRQHLTFDVIVRDADVDEVVFRVENDDVTFSRASKAAKLDGWNIGLVELTRSELAGWNGDRYARATATLSIDRDPTSAVAAVFIPLLASLLIPLLALWMNQANDEGFAVDAFELANMGIGGLFSVIALSFAIYSSNPFIATSDNTVTRLFGLNYATLALSLAIVVVFFRYELPRRWFGNHVQQEMFHVISWAVPLLTLATSITFILVAAA